MAPRAQPAWKIYEEEPTPTSKYNRVSIGDVGFIRQGRFHLLFSAGLPLGERRPGVDVPNAFEQLRVGTMEPGGQRDPCCVAARSSRQPGTNIAITVPSTQPLQPGVSFSYELTGDRGAALTTRHPTYTEDSRSESEFKRYTKRHYKSWVKFARDKKYGTNLRPVLVSGFDMAKDFAIMAYSNVETSVHSGATFSTPMFGSTPASSSWRWRTSCSPHVKHGPQELLPPELRSSRPRPAGNPSTEFNQYGYP
ncbi:hypothetical protein BJ322DRAFT_524556 [Thelephora terrestris]|uniref:Uncharacterized protein n=1 Tax=Thelephora terrestris TaxID=56493 RepID=A0A9P6HKP9_9AGAM|nr:hypothetical protein BJ322DRAFT_524556 [Thelephora terrestris]